MRLGSVEHGGRAAFEGARELLERSTIVHGGPRDAGHFFFGDVHSLGAEEEKVARAELDIEWVDAHPGLRESPEPVGDDVQRDLRRVDVAGLRHAIRDEVQVMLDHETLEVVGARAEQERAPDPHVDPTHASAFDGGGNTPDQEAVDTVMLRDVGHDPVDLREHRSEITRERRRISEVRRARLVHALGPSMQLHRAGPVTVVGEPLGGSHEPELRANAREWLDERTHGQACAEPPRAGPPHSVSDDEQSLSGSGADVDRPSDCRAKRIGPGSIRW
ncbi:hypothetical protein [Polyangium jinanense]|uniref:Uncharacterized protein n=1 Tax=Polyangium jinanense TaxID=2829994 RepID=A0A9X3X7A8_9BACT|nr:hypothetical protein [Polyangium jinanense]MDC3956496.1 hypothetical protein [Polyangium jinanense]MDC3985527.1 hypothetical protein [Polyangium jinanense]